MNTLFFTGNVGKDAEVRTVNGKDVCNFNVAVKQGFSRDAKTEWYRVAVWGARANTLAGHIRKGSKVAVVGELTIGEYNGKPQFDVSAHEVDPFMSRRDVGDTPPAQAHGSSYDDELDNDAPF